MGTVFKQVGIDVYNGQGSSVGDVVTAFASGKLRLLNEREVCGGGKQGL